VRGRVAAIVIVLVAAVSAATAEAGPPPSAGTPAPTLLAFHGGMAVAISEQIHEQGTYLPATPDGANTGYVLDVDPGSLQRTFPPAELRRNQPLWVVPQANSYHGNQVTYDRITVSFGKTTRTLAVDHPIWRATATGTYTAAVSLHYTWQSAAETGEGNATFWFKLRVPRERQTG
jgi:hypothetical protein